MTEERVSRGDIFLVALNPTRGSEIRKTRPYVVVSPDELNSTFALSLLCRSQLADTHTPFVCVAGLKEKTVMWSLIS